MQSSRVNLEFDDPKLPPKKRFTSKIVHGAFYIPVHEDKKPAIQEPAVSTQISTQTTTCAVEKKTEPSDSDMEMSDEDMPGKSKPTIIEVNNLFPSTHTTLFSSNPSFAEVNGKNPLRLALKQHFSMMRANELKPYHYSEVLREIAIYHRNHRHERKPNEDDILYTILFLHEKAAVIEPRSTLANEQLISYKAHQPLFDSAKTSEDRNQRYAKECQHDGYIHFFWTAIDKYFLRLQGIYAQNMNAVLLEVCKHLNSCESINVMRSKHIPTEKINAAIDVFVTAALQLNAPPKQRMTF